MTVIEVDGTESIPVTVDSLTIYAAQRYSIVVTMDQPVDNYCKCSLEKAVCTFAHTNMIIR